MDEYELESKLGLGNKDFVLLLDAHHRKNILNASANFHGLGTSTFYKSDLFEPSFGEIPKANNWYKLTEKGNEKMNLLESLIGVDILQKSQGELNHIVYTTNNK